MTIRHSNHKKCHNKGERGDRPKSKESFNIALAIKNGD